MNTPTAQNKTDTLLGRTVPVKFEDGTAGEIVVHQLRIVEYKKAFPVIGDEVAIVAMATDQTKARIESLTPESYEVLQAAVQEVNANGFFIYAGRQMAATAKNLSALPADVLQAALSQFTSRTSSPVSRLPQG